MGKPWDVEQYGTDPNGRPIYLTGYMRDWWQGVVRELGWEPTIVQGAFMTRVPGGGADDSAGYHDGGGCLDLRTWDRSETQKQALTLAVRRGGAAGWVRDEEHGGMEEHFHLDLGTDFALSRGASWQWLSYINGHDGLNPPGPDYHPRPNPLVVKPPPEYMTDGDTVRQSIRQAGDTKAIANETLEQVRKLKP
jgi:hypothetical protein